MKGLTIWDLDGTLLNTLDDLSAACNYALNTLGCPGHPTLAYRYFVGNGVHLLIKRALPENADQETYKKALGLFTEYYHAHGTDHTAPYPGILETLKSLREADIGVTVFTNKPQPYVPPLFQEYFPGLIDFGVGARDGVPIKPDPTAVREILARFQVDAAHAVYLGDSGVDMQTGKNAGLYTIGVSWGFRTADELLAHGADAIVATPEEALSQIAARFEPDPIG